MRRFDFQQKRNIKTTIIVFSIIFVVVLYFIFTFGLKLVLNSSIFIANMFSKNSNAPLTKTTDIYGTISIDDIPVATNSAQIFVTGSIVNYNVVNFYINGLLIKTTHINASDTFSEKIGDLTPGNNEVFIKATTSDGKNSKKTDIYTVIYKNTKPKLDIKEPADEAKVNNSDLKIKGATDKEIFIKINDSPVVVDANGNFETSITLKEGDNTITIIASDTAGNTETKTLKVNYQKE